MVTNATAQEVTDCTKEASRLEALDRYDVLDTPREEAFDRITRLTKKLFDVPIAIVSFIDAHRQWYKAHEGLEVREVPKESTFCKNIIASGDPLIVLDAAKDPRFADHPFVAGDPQIRFYAGVPLSTRDDYRIGALCIIDTRPRTFSKPEIDVLEDLARLAMDELELRSCVNSDSLTGVLSRRAFKEECQRTVALALRHRHSVSTIAFDLDRFKLINDTHGHAAGDRVLAETAQVCSRTVRKTDLVGRLGGEEFAVLLPNTDQNGALEAAEKLRAAIAHNVVEFRDAKLRITASFGVSTLDQSTRDAEVLLEHADKALYKSKSAGRNHIMAWIAPAAESQPRRRVLKGGQIVFNGGMSVLDCTVRSLSGDGAGLDVSSTVGIPNNFRFAIRSDEFERMARVVERTSRHIEISFV